MGIGGPGVGLALPPTHVPEMLASEETNVYSRAETFKVSVVWGKDSNPRGCRRAQNAP